MNSKGCVMSSHCVGSTRAGKLIDFALFKPPRREKWIRDQINDLLHGRGTENGLTFLLSPSSISPCSALRTCSMRSGWLQMWQLKWSSSRYINAGRKERAREWREDQIGSILRMFPGKRMRIRMREKVAGELLGQVTMDLFFPILRGIVCATN